MLSFEFGAFGPLLVRAGGRPPGPGPAAAAALRQRPAPGPLVDGARPEHLLPAPRGAGRRPHPAGRRPGGHRRRCPACCAAVRPRPGGSRRFTPSPATTTGASAWPRSAPRSWRPAGTGCRTGRSTPRCASRAAIDPAPRAGPRLFCAPTTRASSPRRSRRGTAWCWRATCTAGSASLATRRGLLYPAAWFYRWHGLRFAEAGAVLLVSRGAADTFPFRFNCPREVILCEIT